MDSVGVGLWVGFKIDLDLFLSSELFKSLGDGIVTVPALVARDVEAGKVLSFLKRLKDIMHFLYGLFTRHFVSGQVKTLQVTLSQS